MRKARRALVRAMLKLWEKLVSVVEFIERHPALIVVLDAFLKLLLKAFEK